MSDNFYNTYKNIKNNNICSVSLWNIVLLYELQQQKYLLLGKPSFTHGLCISYSSNCRRASVP